MKNWIRKARWIVRIIIVGPTYRLKRRIKILWLIYRMRTLEREHEKRLRKCAGNSKEIHDEYEGHWHDMDEWNWEYRKLYASNLIERAMELLLPIDYSKIEYEEILGERCMTEESITQLRKEVREELNARRIFVTGWITPLTGIFGAIVGYLLGKL